MGFVICKMTGKTIGQGQLVPVPEPCSTALSIMNLNLCDPHDNDLAIMPVNVLEAYYPRYKTCKAYNTIPLCQQCQLSTTPKTTTRKVSASIDRHTGIGACTSTATIVKFCEPCRYVKSILYLNKLIIWIALKPP